MVPTRSDPHCSERPFGRTASISAAAWVRPGRRSSAYKAGGVSGVRVSPPGLTPPSDSPTPRQYQYRQQVIQQTAPSRAQPRGFQDAEQPPAQCVDDIAWRRVRDRKVAQHASAAREVRRRTSERQRRRQLRISLRQRNVGASFVALAAEPARQIGVLVVPPGRRRGKLEARACRDEPIAQLVVLVAVQRLVEAPGPFEQLARHGEVAAEQVRVCEAMSRITHPFERRFPPRAQHHREQIPASLQLRRQVTDSDDVRCDLRRQVRGQEPRQHVDIVVQEDEQVACRCGCAAIARRGRTSVRLLEHADLDWPLDRSQSGSVVGASVGNDNDLEGSARPAFVRQRMQRPRGRGTADDRRGHGSAEVQGGCHGSRIRALRSVGGPTYTSATSSKGRRSDEHVSGVDRRRQRRSIFH